MPCRYQVEQVQLSQPWIPHLTSEGALKKYMIHSFSALVTDDASIGVLQSMTKSPVIGPTSSVNDQPPEECDPRRRRCFPYLFCSKRLRRFEEHYMKTTHAWHCFRMTGKYYIRTRYTSKPDRRALNIWMVACCWSLNSQAFISCPWPWALGSRHGEGRWQNSASLSLHMSVQRIPHLAHRIITTVRLPKWLHLGASVHGPCLTSIHSSSPFLEREEGQRRQRQVSSPWGPGLDLDMGPVQSFKNFTV
jgi:hypothetical protein